MNLLLEMKDIKFQAAIIEIIDGYRYLISMAENKDEIIATINTLMFKLQKELLKNDLPPV